MGSFICGPRIPGFLLGQSPRKPRISRPASRSVWTKSGRRCKMRASRSDAILGPATSLGVSTSLAHKGSGERRNPRRQQLQQPTRGEQRAHPREAGGGAGELVVQHPTAPNNNENLPLPRMLMETRLQRLPERPAGRRKSPTNRLHSICSLTPTKLHLLSSAIQTSRTWTLTLMNSRSLRETIFINPQVPRGGMRMILKR